MASKKYTLLAAMLVFLQLAGTAQTKTDWGWDWKDSSKVPTKSLPQYNEFLNNQFPYPPKPRNAWELGISVGNAFILGERPIFAKNQFGGSYTGGLVAGLSLRKALGHVMSVRGTLNWSTTSIPSYNTVANKQVATKNNTLMGSVDAIFSLNTASHYRGNPKVNLYVLGGYSLIATQFKVRQANGDYRLAYYNKSQTAGMIQDLTLIHGANFGGGFAFKLSNKINLGVEQVFTAPLFGNDFLDGNKVGLSKGDMYSYSTIRLNINLGN